MIKPIVNVEIEKRFPLKIDVSRRLNISKIMLD